MRPYTVDKPNWNCSKRSFTPIKKQGRTLYASQTQIAELFPNRPNYISDDNLVCCFQEDITNAPLGRTYTILREDAYKYNAKEDIPSLSNPQARLLIVVNVRFSVAGVLELYRKFTASYHGNVRLVCAELFSYQDGDHELRPKNTERPKNWAGQYYLESAEAYEGDIVIGVGVSDRYNYVQERNPNYFFYRTPHEALEALVDSIYNRRN